MSHTGFGQSSRASSRYSPASSRSIWPGVTALALLFLIAFWAILLGVGEIGGAFAARQRGSNAWGWTLAAGVLNIVFGVLLLIWPGSGILTLVWLVGIFALAGGIALIVLAFRVRSVARSTGSALQPADPRPES